MGHNGHLRDTKRGPDHSKDTPKAVQKHWGTPRALQGHSKSPWTFMALGHSKDTSVIGYSSYLGIWALRHFGTRSARATLFGRLDPNFQWAASGHLSAPILFKDFRFLSSFDIFRHLFF